MKKNRLSHSQVRMYTECSLKYKYHYKDRLRSKYTSGALLFGSALDSALNKLLKNKDLDASIKTFEESFLKQEINGKEEYLPESSLVVYAERDFDKDLLEDEDYRTYEEVKKKYFNTKEFDLLKDHSYVSGVKKEKGFVALDDNEKKLYSIINWLSMRRKGHIMINSYFKDIIPRIKNVVCIQKEIELVNEQGDSVTGFLDLVVDWEDGNRYLLDNKTSTIQYVKDQAMRNQQLILYYHSEKEELKLNGVGFLVLYKTIIKNKTKKCSVCGNNGTGKQHRTCDAIVNNDRCNGKWIEKIRPEANIEVILNQVSSTAEDLVIQTFDSANKGIHDQNFGPNLEACNKNGIICPYFNKCWFNKDEDLIKVEEKSK